MHDITIVYHKTMITLCINSPRLSDAYKYIGELTIIALECVTNFS